MSPGPGELAPARRSRSEGRLSGPPPSRADGSSARGAGCRSADHGGRNLRGSPRRDRRLVPERRRLPPAPPRVARRARPRTARRAARRSSPTTTSRSSPGCCCAVTAAAAGAPYLVRYPLVEALTAALCVGAVLAHHSAAGIALSVVADPARRAGRADRPRAPDHPQPDHRPRRGARARDRARARPRRRARTADRRRRRRRLPAARPRWPIRAAWAWATSSSPGMMGLFLGAAVAPAILIALLAGVVARRGRHRPQGRAGGTQDGRPVRSVPRARGAARRFRRAAARRCLRQPLPSLKRPALDADTPRAGDLSRCLKRAYARCESPHESPQLHMKLPAQPRPPLRRGRRRPGHPARLRRGRAGARQRIDPRRAGGRPAAPGRRGARRRSDGRERAQRRPARAVRRERAEQARARRRRQPAHGAAHARAAARHRPARSSRPRSASRPRTRCRCRSATPSWTSTRSASSTRPPVRASAWCSWPPSAT